jgi:hypothetical protein
MKWTDEDLDLALRELGDQELPAAAVTAVRARVLEAVERPRLRWWMWAWAPALGLLAVAFLATRPLTVAPPPLMAAAPAPPAAWAAGEGRTAPPVNIVPAAERPLLEATDIPGLVRVATRDPNIIIYWSFDNGEGDEE